MADEVELDFPRMWVEVPAPASWPDAPQRVYRFDLTWLTSRWRCVYGQGCRGIDATRPADGCCTLGAHFTDRADQRRVLAAARALEPEDWQHHPGRRRWPVDAVVAADGADTVTRVVDGACVFLNRPGFPGGAGCALHLLARRRGEHPLTTKPDVCWQLPLRRTFREVTRPDGTTYEEVSVGEYDRRGWGPGGHNLDWYCTGSPLAHTATAPVYEQMADELRALVGAQVYDELARVAGAYLAEGSVLEHPATTARPGGGPRGGRPRRGAQ